MEANVYGLIGIIAPFKAWNVHNDKTGKDAIYGSNRTLKYCIKNHWRMSGHKVMLITSGNSDEQLTLEERYKDIYGEDFDKDYKESIDTLMEVIDCKHFGFTYKRNGRKIEQEGAVIIGPGRSIDPTVTEKPALSDMVHYAHPFSINPMLLANSCGAEYTEEDFEAFKEAAACGADLLDSMQDRGCQNEYLLVVKTKTNTFLKPLDRYLVVEGNEIKVDKLAEYLFGFGKKILSVDLYYNTETMTVEDSEKARGIIKMHGLNTI